MAITVWGTRRGRGTVERQIATGSKVEVKGRHYRELAYLQVWSSDSGVADVEFMGMRGGIVARLLGNRGDVLAVLKAAVAELEGE